MRTRTTDGCERDAFFEICNNPEPGERAIVSLYVSVPFYGGPEEGGWWGNDTSLVAYQIFPTMEQAEAAKAKIDETVVEKRNREERRRFGEQCLRELAWLEARGLDADYLPEVDGESKYYVVIEDRAGSHESRGCRHYE